MIDKDTGIVLSNTITESYGENTSDTSQYPILLDKAYDPESNYKVTNTIGSIFRLPCKGQCKSIKL